MEPNVLTKSDNLQSLVGKKIRLVSTGKIGVVEKVFFDDKENTSKGEGVIVFTFVGDPTEKFASGNSGFEYELV